QIPVPTERPRHLRPADALLPLAAPQPRLSVLQSRSFQFLWDFNFISDTESNVSSHYGDKRRSAVGYGPSRSSRKPKHFGDPSSCKDASVIPGNWRNFTGSNSFPFNDRSSE